MTKYDRRKPLPLNSGAIRIILYYYLCADCGKKRQTKYKQKAERMNKDRLCAKCFRKVPKNQIPLFKLPKLEEENAK